MASQQVYDVLRKAYDEELARCEELTGVGKIYLGICAFFLGGSAFKLDQSFAEASLAWKAIYAGGAASFCVALLLIIAALGIYSYAGVSDAADFVKGLGEESPTDEEFLDDCVVDLARATPVNSRQNDIRAHLLLGASVLMVLGACGVFAYLFVQSW